MSFALPQTAVVAVEGVVILARLGLPGPGAVFGATYLDDSRLVAVIDGIPVEAVAAEIHQSTAALQMRMQGIEHACRDVLGMRACQNHPVGAQSFIALAVEILVRQHVVVEAGILEPREDVGVAVERPQAGLGATICRRQATQEYTGQGEMELRSRPTARESSQTIGSELGC